METLITTAANGSKRVWRIWNERSIMYTEYGILGGKMITSSRQIEGKNKGKSNETSAEEQAAKEVKSRWLKKIDEGYKPMKKSSKQDDTIYLPMLAQPYDKKKVKFPCFVQPKLDGIRALYYRGALWSRKGKMFTTLDHIVSDLKDIDVVLDGELYSDKGSFQEICSWVKKKSSKTSLIKYIVYDLISDSDYSVRYQQLMEIISSLGFSRVLLHTTEICHNDSEVKSYLVKYTSSGFEGVMIRNFKGGYAMKSRSKNLQKLKQFIDKEFEITGYTEGVGAEKGCIIFICKTDSGKEFNVRPTGTRQDRTRMFKSGKKYIGKLLTVKYQELTDDGIPRFPVGIIVRDYE